MSSIEEGAAALETFLDRGLISEVLQPIKSGKEAATWLCRAGGSLGSGLIVAKVYKERNKRSFRNDAMYHAGREIPNSRVKRAFENKTEFGREVQQMIWVGQEYEVLEVLSEEGLDVPRPLANAGACILMDFIGDANGAAPQLAQAKIDPRDARRAFERIIWNIEEMLVCCCVHGDLSAYNILWWQGRAWIIDFPQAVDPRFNPHARDLLERDITNVCKAFERYGVQAHAPGITRRLWETWRLSDYASER